MKKSISEMLTRLVMAKTNANSEYPQSEQPYSLLEHCLRAIEKGATIGSQWIAFDRLLLVME